MKATARRSGRTGLTHRIDVRQHHLVADEPPEKGGEDEGPDPQEMLAASLASCTAITMEIYASRKGWDVRQLEVDCEYTPAERGSPTNFKLTLRLPNDLDPEQIRLLSTIAAKCPVHRTLAGEVKFDQEVELFVPATT
jgi:putative redox protein